MTTRGKRVKFHGAYASKADAKRKEKRVKGGYIKPISVRGKKRYSVIGPR